MKPCSKKEAEEAIQFAGRKFGVEFFDEQKSAIESFMTGSDVFVGLPTGYGKSIIFQSIPLCYEHVLKNNDASLRSDQSRRKVAKAIGIVVSPLVSLCKNQIETLTNLGIKAIYLGDASDGDWKNVEDGVYSHVYASPEMLLADKFSAILMSDLYSERLCGIFVDEVHCVAKWGFSSTRTKAFREDYSRLAELRSLVASSVRMAVFTATATSETRELICQNLALQNLVTITATPNKANIRYCVVKVKSSDTRKEMSWLLKRLQRDGTNTQRVIVYCQRLNDCNALYGMFEKGMNDRYNKVPPEERLYAMYTSSTDDGLKDLVHQSFSKSDGTIRILFATVAFGMGIDVQGLHTVIHFGSPADTDDYLQETGRAGRQGHESVAVLIHHSLAFTIRKPSPAIKNYVEGKECRRKTLLRDFTDSQVTNSSFTCCDPGGGSRIDKVYGDVPAFSGGFSQIWYIDRVVFVTDESAQFCKIGCILENFGKKVPNFSQIGCFSIKNWYTDGWVFEPKIGIEMVEFSKSVCDKDQPSWVELAISDKGSISSLKRVVEESDKEELNLKLKQYRNSLIDALPSEGLLAGPDLTTGFPESFIKRLLDTCENVLTFDEFWIHHPFCDKPQAEAVYNIMELVLCDCCKIETVHLGDVQFASEEFEETESDSEYQEIVLDSDGDED